MVWFESEIRRLRPRVTRIPPRVTSAIVKHFSTRLQVLRGLPSQSARDDEVESLYDDATHIMQSSTRAMLQSVHDVLVNGLLPGVDGGTHYSGAQANRPVVVKNSICPAEVRILGAGLEFASHYLVPIRRVDRVLVMPRYAASADCVPSDFLPATQLAGLRRLETALRHMHSKGLCHCDVREANVFLDMEGRWFLGDFDASQPDGALVTKYGAQSVPSWFHDRSKGLPRASQVLDRVMLGTVAVIRLSRAFRAACDEDLDTALRWDMQRLVAAVPAGDARDFVVGCFLSGGADSTGAGGAGGGGGGGHATGDGDDGAGGGAGAGDGA